MTATKAAVWLSVSTGHQETDNQVPDVEQFAAHHGYEIAETFTVSDSVWKDGAGGPEYQAALEAALDGTWAGRYQVLIVRALSQRGRCGQ